MPGSTYCSARSAAASFQASLLMLILPARCAPLAEEHVSHCYRLPISDREGAANASPLASNSRRLTARAAAHGQSESVRSAQSPPISVYLISTNSSMP